MSYSKLNQQIEQNHQKEIRQQQNPKTFDQDEIEITTEPILAKLLNASGYEEAVDFHLLKRKKTKRTISQGRSL